MQNGAAKSAGASCNTFIVEDSVDGIFAAVTWAGKISQRQGAPTLILSKLRPAGSAISTGGTSSGPCSFARVFDSVASSMLRPGEKKNGVTVLFLDADHPDIDEWISYKFKATLVRAYTGVLFRPYKKYSQELLDRIAKAYDTYQVGFLCKTIIQDGQELFPNVCTEIRQKHKGQCILGALDLSSMAGLTTVEFVDEFRSAAIAMAKNLWINGLNADQDPDLYAYEKQVGLGFVGMANFLGLSGVTYQDAVDWLETELLEELQDVELTYMELMERLAGKVNPEDLPGNFWLKFIGGVIAGSEAVGDDLDRIWTAQPTAHTSLRLGQDRVSLSKKFLLHTDAQEQQRVLGYMSSKGWGRQIRNLTDEQADKVVIALGLPTTIAHIRDAVAAELQPPYAVRLPGKQGSSAIHQSQLKGSVELTYDYRIQTRDEVPYEVYYRFCCLIQLVFDFTGKAHTLSHSTWAEEVTGAFVRTWLDGPLGSLYYRLEPTPAQYLDKSETWDDVDLSDMFAPVNDEPEGLPTKGFCPLPKPGQLRSECEVCSM
jgi:hypothetical protein